MLNSIPSTSDSSVADADTANRHKLKAAYDSCLDVETLNEVGMKPLVPLVEYVIDKFGAFDVKYSKDEESISWSDVQDWEGTYGKGYQVPERLAGEGERANELRVAKKEGRVVGGEAADKPAGLEVDMEVSKRKKDGERQTRITETLAFLHSRGELAGLN